MGMISTNVSAGDQPSSVHYKVIQLILYNLGRISTYSLIGLLLGSVSAALADFGNEWETIFRSIAGATLILMGLYLAGFGRVMLLFESAGQHVWKYIQPLASNFLPPKNRMQVFMLGALWGWLPCGMVYSALIWSASQGSATQSALLMFCFGLGTAPALLLSGGLTSGAATIFSKQKLRKGLGILLIIYGLWTLFGTMQWLNGSAQSDGQNHQDHSHHMHMNEYK